MSHLSAEPPAGASALAWQAEFANLFSIRERCPLAHAGRAASLLFGSLGLLAPSEALSIVLADKPVLAALREAMRHGVTDESPDAAPRTAIDASEQESS